MMTPRNVLAFSISLLLAAPVLAQAPAAAKKATAAQPIFMPAADLKWTDLDPKGAPGVKIATLWGDHTKGRSARISSCRRDSPCPFTRTPMS